MMTLADQSGLSQLLAGKICIPAPKTKSGSANASPKLDDRDRRYVCGRGQHR